MAPKPSPSGKLIVFEGPDGTGKSTACAATAMHLKSHGIEVVNARLPGGTAAGEAVRSFFKANAGSLSLEDQIGLLLFAKRQLLIEIIRPALNRGAYVVCDRFTDSLFAYQWAGFSKFDPAIRRRIEDNLMLYEIDVEVDVKIILDCPIMTSIERMRNRNEKPDALDDVDIDFKRRVRSYYRDHMKESPQGTTVYINTFDGLDSTLADIDRIVRSLMLPAKRHRRLDAGKGLELQLVA